MKSKEGKERWRTFISAYEEKIEDFNFGTMLRASPAVKYDEQDSIFGVYRGLSLRFWWLIFTAVRMQFYAIEIAR